MSMNTRTLEYVVAVADLRHFGKAAERCHVGQPTLSLQIHRLEEYLGVRLFERDAHGARLTTDGERLIHGIRSAHDQIALLKTEALQRQHGHYVEMRTAAADSAL